MALSFKKTPGKNHLLSERMLIALMAVIVVIAAFVIKVSTFFLTTLNPVSFISKLRNPSETTDIDTKKDIS